MASSLARSQIVQEALALAGRSTELNGACAVWLNLFLRHVAITFRFPELRRIGDPITLAIGQQTALLPLDFGAGMEKRGMIFGDDRKPIDEKSFEDFTSQNGFQPVNTGNGRPYFYIVDRNAGVFRFSIAADQAYTFIPTYFIMPTLPPADISGDPMTVWLDNDLICVEGLMWFIYKFTNDDREDKQGIKVEKMINDWKRELVKMGGTSRVIPSPGKFKNVKFFGP